MTTTPAPFDYDAPLPPMPSYRARAWESDQEHDDNETKEQKL